MAVTLTGATPGLLVLAPLGGATTLATTINLAAALATLPGPLPGAVPASTAAVAATLAGIRTIAPTTTSAMATTLATTSATTMPTTFSTTTSAALGKGQPGLMATKELMKVGQEYGQSEREKWNCQPLDYRLHGPFLLCSVNEKSRNACPPLQ
jgi:hypothetical protein